MIRANGFLPVGEIMEEAPAVKTKNDKFVKTLIIGAGIAGLSAANHLVKNNDTNFVVLEAKDKIGGRISSFEIRKTLIPQFFCCLIIGSVSWTCISPHHK